MAVTSVARKLGGRTGSIDRTWHRKYSESWIVETDDPTTGVIAVRTAAGLPQLGDHYVDSDGTADLGAFVESIEVSEESETHGGYQWTARVSYGPYDLATFGADPTLWPIRVSFGGDPYDRVVWFDRDGNPIRNTAGDPFGEPIVIDDSRATFVVTKNILVADFDATLASEMSDTINDATWNGFAAGWVKVGIIQSGDEQYDSNGQRWYYAVKFSFAVKRGGWKKDVLDAGFAELDGSSPPVAKPMLNNGQPLSEPVPLDGSGHRLASTGTPVTLSFDVYDEADFSVFGINLAVRLGL